MWDFQGSHRTSPRQTGTLRHLPSPLYGTVRAAAEHPLLSHQKIPTHVSHAIDPTHENPHIEKIHNTNMLKA